MDHIGTLRALAAATEAYSQNPTPDNWRDWTRSAFGCSSAQLAAAAAAGGVAALISRMDQTAASDPMEV